MKYSNIFLHPWDSSHRLWQAFWLLFFLGNTLGVLVISTIVVMPLAPLGFPQAGGLFTSILNIGMPIVTGISVFKCWKNSSHPAWGLLACNVVVLWIIWVCYITFVGVP